ncbi:MAG TPA: SURF1 family protein [Longimicrobiales bacterium]|nr:SURF1 family protein [Longimicrobiales bacterium]
MNAPRPLTLTPAGIAATALVVVVAVVCVRLGFWQLDRLGQRRAANEGLEERIAADPLDLDRAPRDTAGLVMREAVARGRWDGETAIALAGRSRAGAPGVHVLQPFQLEGGGWMLVDRGFVPAADAATAPAGVRARGAATIRGRLRPLESDATTDGRLRPAREQGGTLPTWFARSPDGIGEHLPQMLAPLYVVAESATADAPYPAASAPPELDEGPHLGYALQWFSFAAIAVVGWGAMAMRRSPGQESPASTESPT